jgi:hypothetical protein
MSPTIVPKTPPTIIPVLKIPEILDEFLFLNPDTAVAFNDLSPSNKNEWIKLIREARTIPAMEKLLKHLKEKLESKPID